MEFQTTTVELRKLVPSEGHWLTQADEVSITSRIFSKEMYLGVNDTAERWTEITDSEYEDLLLQQQAAQEELALNSEEVSEEEFNNYLNSLTSNF